MIDEKTQAREPKFGRVCEQLKCLCRDCAERYASSCPWRGCLGCHGKAWDVVRKSPWWNPRQEVERA